VFDYRWQEQNSDASSIQAIGSSLICRAGNSSFSQKWTVTDSMMAQPLETCLNGGGND
jgi:hypothetical protein